MKKEIDLFAAQVVSNWDDQFVPGKTLCRVFGPVWGEPEVKALLKVISNNWFLAGAITEEFERKFAPLLGKKYGVFVNSGTSANMLAAYASKILIGKDSPRVVVPSSFFPSTVNPYLQFGFRPTFIDCDLDGSYNISVGTLHHLLGTSFIYDAVTFAHVLGNPPDMDKIMDFVDFHRCILIEDCCDALGSTYKGKPLGSFGRFATCSFFPAHHMTSIEGGFVACDTEEDYKLLKSLRDWGRGCWCVGKEQSSSKYGACGRRHSDWLGIGKNVDHRYVFNHIGFNLKATEMQAAVALAQLDRLEEFENTRKENYNKLVSCIEKYPNHFQKPTPQKDSTVNWFAVPIRVISKKFDRDEIIKYLEDHMVQTRLLFTGNGLRHPAYKSLGINPALYPNSDIVLKEVFMLGCSQVLTNEMMNYVCSTIDKFMENKMN